MSRSIKRNIIVLNTNYYWILDGNSIDSNTHVRIHVGKLTKSILYLDPYNWHFEIRPKTIEKAILLAINLGWDPKVNRNNIYLSMSNDGELYQLSKGIDFGYLNKK